MDAALGWRGSGQGKTVVSSLAKRFRAESSTLTCNKGDLPMRRLISLPACIALVLMFGTSAALAQYQQKNLNSNQIGWALHADPLLANGWGLAYGPGSPFWVNDNTSGWSTLYDGSGKQVQAVKVVVPTAGENGPGSPTGIVFNGSQDFQFSGHPAVFIFDTLDGTISGWSPA